MIRAQHRFAGGAIPRSRSRVHSFLGTSSGGASSTRLIVIVMAMFLMQLFLIAFLRSSSSSNPVVDSKNTNELTAVQGQGGAASISPERALMSATEGAQEAKREEDERAEVQKVTTELPTLPKPMIVACLSTMRTVSTAAFNLVRVLMEHVDPNSVSGWESDFISSKTQTTIKDIVPKAHGKVSVVYKSHAANQYYHGAADFIVSTYRDPYDIMCSVGHMFKPAVFQDDDYAKGKCGRVGLNEYRIKKLAEARGKGRSLHVDSSMLHTVDGMTEIVETLVRLWGVKGGKVDARAIALEVAALKAPDPGIFPVAHPRTELHAHHITNSSTTKGDCEELRKVLDSDAECRAWHDKYLEMFPPGGPLLRDDVVL